MTARGQLVLEQEGLAGSLPINRINGHAPVAARTKSVIAEDIYGRSWKGRRVAIVGLARSGLAAAKLLCKVGAQVRVSDSRNSDGLAEQAKELERIGVEAVELGGHSRSFFEGTELIVVSPGVPESALPITWAAQHDVPVVSEIELAYVFCRSPIIAVTGTNGKSTAVSLIAAILNACGRPAVACGNLGEPFSSVVQDLEPQVTAVVEISSFQLLCCELFRPHIGVLLNVGTNHLDRHQDATAYKEAKFRLFRRQTADDWAVLNGSDAATSELERRLISRCVWFGENRSNSPPFWIAPQTQREMTNCGLAVLQVARILGIPDPLTWQVIRSFRGLEHRLESVNTIRGVHLVNDSKSTTPESLIFALNQIPGNVVLIMGGRDKGMDFSPLAQKLNQPRIQAVVLIGEARQRLQALLGSVVQVVEALTLKEAVQEAFSLANPGTTVLFSPACASFDMFKDFEDRGRAFKEIIRAMPDTLDLIQAKR